MPRTPAAVSALLVACASEPADVGPGVVDSGITSPSPEVNRPPRVELRALETQEDTPGIGALVGADPDGGPIVWQVEAPPAHGELTLHEATSIYIYEPDPNFFGGDAFALAAVDAGGASTSAVVDVTVLPENDPPVARGIGPLLVRTGGTWRTTLTGSDVDGDALTWSIGQSPTIGTATIDGLTGDLVYTAGELPGPDPFTVVASDGALQSPAAIVAVEVVNNTAPVVYTQGDLTTAEDQPITGQVSAFDAENDPLTFVVATPPQLGNATITPTSGAFAYVPSPDTHGVDRFEVIATDGLLESLPIAIEVVVTPVNDPPILASTHLTVAPGQTGTVVPGVTDADGDPVTLSLHVPPVHGVASVDPAVGAVVYTPDDGYVGSDALTIRATDGFLTTQGVVTIDVQP